MLQIVPVPLTQAAFTAFGDVVELDGSVPLAINQGFAERFHDLAEVDVATGGGTACVSLFTVRPRPHPIVIKLMECHPLGSQIFYPLEDKPWLVVVCVDPHNGSSYRAFTATGQQGVNYAPGVWHHPVLVPDSGLGSGLDSGRRFLIIDRKGPGHNLQEEWLSESSWLALTI